ncbi:MAG: HAMP domain-containing protein, partial [Acidobacteriaceae bacterium]|nr:HAMP domain-containing protein [Acidobacteriaceae bacterium]
MKSLFLKIFVSYYVAHALFFVLALLAAFAMRPSREIAELQTQQTRFLTDALQAHQSGGEQALWKYLHGIHETYHVRLFILDPNGKDLLGRKPPEWVQRAQAGQLSTANTFWGRLRPNQFLRGSVTTPDGQQYTIVTDLPPEPHGPFAFRGIPGLGLLIGILCSGLVCYILARYLTSPITRLRAAAQKMAAGDLSARAGIPGSRRRDETAELVRDFDVMADRLESLVGAQRQLLRDISHELRSPLARLNVALELARQRSGADASSALDRIERETNRLNEMIQRLLTLVRLEGGDDSLEKSPVHLEELIREIAKDAAFEAQNRQCQVDVEISADCVVTGSASLLHSAVENVVRNAIRYTEEGTAVRIRLLAEEGADGSQ